MHSDEAATAVALGRIDWPVRTQRLVLRPATAAPEDVEATWQIRRLPEVHRWLVHDDADRAGYAARYLEPDRLACTLVYELGGPENPGGPVIGDLLLRVEDGWAQGGMADRARGVQARLGWVLAPEHQGHGYATEAVRELLRICFVELGLRRVVAECFADNTPSWRLMERLGMRREQHAVRESLLATGEWVDAFTYALLADEYRG